MNSTSHFCSAIIERMLEKKIPLCVLTDLQSLFNVNVKSVTTTERILIKDVLTIQRRMNDEK